MSCDPSCITNVGGLSLDVQCPVCGFRGWTPTGGEIYPWPEINSTGHFVESPTNEFLSELLREPKRTRLNLLCEDWSINAQAYSARLEQVNQQVAPFGLSFVQLREGVNMPSTHADIVRDEPLILTSISSTIPSNEFQQCLDPVPQSNSVEEPEFQAMMEDVGKLRQRLQRRDIDERLRPESQGFHEKQHEMIEEVLRKTGTLTIGALPTGYGKTRIAQAIAWALRRQGKGPAVMISPLISLMDDQRAQFQTFSDDIAETELSLHDDGGYESIFLTTVEKRDPLNMIPSLKKDEIDLFCCSPERMMSCSSSRPMWIDQLTRLENPVSLLIIDEAHVVGDWGASIRPEFQLLNWVKDRLLRSNPDLRIILISATISVEEERELKHLFIRGLAHNSDSNIIRHHQTRPDLYFHIERYQTEDSTPVEEEEEEEEEEGVVEQIVRRLHRSYLSIPQAWNRHQDVSNYRPPLILYTPLRSFAEGRLKSLAKQHFHNVRTYTGQTNSDQREVTRDAFVKNEFDCLIATSAFGMGIDKPDAWMTSYIGMPHTVKGLYQAFGRAARRSNWDSAVEVDWNSGTCFGAIPYDQPRRFKASLGIPKTLERLYDMFSGSGTKFINGYALVPIFSGIEATAWRPGAGFVCEQEDEEDEEDEDTHDDYSLTRHILQFEEERRQEEYQNRMRRDSLYSKRMWAISSLHRTMDIEFLGIHRGTLFRSKSTSQTIELIDVLSDDGGYNLVMDLLSNIPSGFSIDSRSTPYAVLKFNKLITNWTELAQICVEGYEILHKRHETGRTELIDFLKNIDEGKCIRSQFGITIGSPLIEDCASNTGIPGSMPCSNCRADILPNRNQDEIIWSDPDTTRDLGWHQTPSEEYLWSDLTYSNRFQYYKEDAYPCIAHNNLHLDHLSMPHLNILSDGVRLCNGDFSGLLSGLDEVEYELIHLSQENNRQTYGTITISRAADGAAIIMYDGGLGYTIWSNILFNTEVNQCFFWS